MKRIFLSAVIIIALLCPSAYAADKVVARVNGTVFTQKDLDIAVDRLIPRMTYHGSVSTEKRKHYYGKALEEMIDRELEYQDALAKGMKIDKKEIDAYMAAVRKRFKSNNEYKVALSNEGVTEEQIRAAGEKEMLIHAIRKKMVTGPSQMSDAELKAYYEKNSAKFKQPESVKLRLISSKDKKKAEDILAKLKGGADFGDVAYSQSEDAYRVMGGELGYMHRGRMLPELDKVAFKLKTGDLSGLIKAGDHWYIIQVEDKKPESQLSFDEVKEKLRKNLEAKRAADLEKKWIDGLKAKSKIEVLIKTES
jgi:parvulin-like peptidyl-prolyl isomerase